MLYYTFVKLLLHVVLCKKVSELVEMHSLQWHSATSALMSIHNTHLDFCTASNIHKNILAVMLTSVRWGAAKSPKWRGGKLFKRVRPGCVRTPSVWD